MEARHRQPWNKGKFVVQKARIKLRDIRIRLQLQHRIRDLARFNRRSIPGSVPVTW